MTLDGLPDTFCTIVAVKLVLISNGTAHCSSAAPPHSFGTLLTEIHVKIFERDEEDEDREIESYPGILGHASDDYPLSVLDPVLEPLNEIDWHQYASVAEFGEARTLIFRIGDTQHQITIGDEVRLEDILDQTTFVDVYSDFPDDQGMTSMSFYPFFKVDGVSDEYTKNGIRALVEVLKADCAALRQLEAEWIRTHQ